MDLSRLPVENGFRLRGEQVTRLETFVDAAFAFAVTLLVVSFQAMPHTFAELYDALRRLPAFLAGFAILAMFWHAHNRFSRRTGLEDGAATLLSLALVAATLFYVYPLRMVMSSAMHFFTGGWAPSELEVSSFREFQLIWVLYGIGFAALASITGALHWQALRSADALRLDAAERLTLKGELGNQAVLVAVSLLSMTIALHLPPRDGLVQALPGFCYCLLGVLLPPISIRNARQVARLAALRDGAAA